jgi:hypothetical protein
MIMLTDTAINLLLQVPLAGVVVLVVVLFLRHLKEGTAAFMTAQQKQSEAAATAQKEQIVMFMGAIKEQREENIKSLDDLTKGFGGLCDLITSRLEEMATAKTIRRVRGKS